MVRRTQSAAKLMCGLMICCGGVAAAVGQSQPAPEVSSASPKQLSERAKEQTRRLAGYLSMNGEFSLERLTVENAVEKIKRVAEYTSADFDAAPALSAVGPDLMRFYVRAEQVVVPHLRLAEVRNVEDLVLDLVLEMGSKAYADAALLAWQAEADRRCRDGYKRIMPLIEAMAAPVDTKAATVEMFDFTCGIRDGAVNRMQARNRSGKRLTNVTLAVELISLDKRRSQHFYFMDAWEPDEFVSLRLAADWSRIGSLGTVGGEFRVYADELSTREKSFRIEGNLPYAAERLLHEMRSIMPRRPKWVAQRLHPVRRELEQCQSCQGETVRDIRKRMTELMEEANTFYGQERARLTRQIEDLGVQEKKLQVAPENESSGRREGRLRQLQDVKKRIDDLIEQRRELDKLQAD